ncbi:MAG: DUF3987 domain-containing protein [Verrucomicrobiaceae bacterium]|nr:DUF3987 domain-containing protein [Verrucomicrobiaceae bacterium]
MTHDITGDLRLRAGYRPTLANEKHEKNEIQETSATQSSSISFFSSQMSPRPILADDVFYGPIGEIVTKHQGITEADPAAILAQVLVGVGSIIGRGAYFLADGARHHANLFAIVCGRTAKARKGTSWARARSVLNRLDEEWAEGRLKSGVVSGEGITQVFAGDDDKRLLLYESEFAQVLQAMKREGNTVSALLRQAWDGGRLAVLRKKDKIEVDGAHISLIGHITLPELHRLLDTVEISNGLANRCLWVFADRTTLLPEGGIEPDLEKPLAVLQEKIPQASDLGQVTRHPGVAEFWSDIYTQLSRECSGKVGELLSRAEAQVMRLALIYALADASRYITADHLTAGLAFWRYCEDSTRHIFGLHLLSNKAKRILEALTSGPRTKTEIHALFSNNATKVEIDHALDELGPIISKTPDLRSGGYTLHLGYVPPDMNAP